jgi:hypothetical protein
MMAALVALVVLDGPDEPRPFTSRFVLISLSYM